MNNSDNNKWMGLFQAPQRGHGFNMQGPHQQNHSHHQGPRLGYRFNIQGAHDGQQQNHSHHHGPQLFHMQGPYSGNQQNPSHHHGPQHFNMQGPFGGLQQNHSHYHGPRKGKGFNMKGPYHGQQQNQLHNQQCVHNESHGLPQHERKHSRSYNGRNWNRKTRHQNSQPQNFSIEHSIQQLKQKLTEDYVLLQREYRKAKENGQCKNNDEKRDENDDTDKVEFNEDDMCVICWEKSRDASIIHNDTAHIVCCIDCAKLLKRRGDSCPICRKSIDHVVKNYCN